MFAKRGEEETQVKYIDIGVRTLFMILNQISTRSSRWHALISDIPGVSQIVTSNMPGALCSPNYSYHCNQLSPM